MDISSKSTGDQHTAAEMNQVVNEIEYAITSSGQTAKSLSKDRNFVPTVGVSSSEATLRRMCLYWGVVPLADAPVDDSKKLLAHVVERGIAAGVLVAGDRVVLISGTGLKGTAHNMIVVHEVE